MKISLVLNILKEELDQQVPLLILVHNVPDCGSFPEKFHQSALHNKPQHPRQVEENGQENQVERNPLVIGVINHRDSIGIIRQELGREPADTSLNRKNELPELDENLSIYPG